MSDKFQIIEVPADVPREQEQMGTKFKFWYFDKKHGYCLFKEGHPNTGEDWAERVVAELCELLEMPHAVYKLAVWRNRTGVISPNFIRENEILVPGNEVLFRRDASYPKKEKKTKKHSVETIFTTFEPLEVQLPTGMLPHDITTAQQVFLGYLMLDVWIGNTDRHHENWAMIRQSQDGIFINRLAPTHDHAASLGCMLQDKDRYERLTTKDKNRRIEAYVNSAKARSAIYGDATDTKPLTLIDAFRAASLHNPQATGIWLKQLEHVIIKDVWEVFERIPKERISGEAKEFALRMLEINRERILRLKR